MAQPLLASARIDFQITVDSFTHHLRHYCEAVNVGGTWTLNDRSGTTSIGATNAIDRLYTLLAPIYDTAKAVFGVATVETLSGTQWLPQFAHNTTVTASDGTAYVPGSQATSFLRDTAFKKIHLDLLETSLFLPAHLVSIPSSGPLNTLFNAYSSASANASDPYQWVRSRGNRILATTSFVSYTTALNRKVRRRRGLA